MSPKLELYVSYIYDKIKLCNKAFIMTIYYMIPRKRTFSIIIGYGLHLYFLGLSFRNAAKALSFLLLTKISHVSIWNWPQKYKPKRKISQE